MNQRLSASRLNNFLGCAHHAALSLDGVKPPMVDNPSLELVRKKGFEHEAAVLAVLEATYGKAESIPGKAPLQTRIDLTSAAINAGAPLIYQGAFANARWVGFPDFLIRTGRSGDGWLYEPEDAKLARKAKAEHVLQLGIYSALLREASGVPVGGGAIHVGGGEPARFDLRRTEHITARLMGKLEAFSDLAVRDTKPVRCTACAQCPFKDSCEAEWRAADSPVFVAGIRADQMLKLEAAGVTTLTGLAALDPTGPAPGIGQEAFGKIVRQARLQMRGAEGGKHLVELLPVEPGRGLTLMPPPAEGDLFFDIEGDPHYPEGLEYLLGLWGPLGPSGEDVFRPIWAHDHDAEKLAFETLIRLFARHLRKFPEARIYHYAPYETVALKRLAMRYATMEAELDDLLRGQRFVDLYQIARQAIRASTEGYSLKNLEKIYWGGREGDVANAGDSIVEYERWRELGEPAILDAIGHYNQEDCFSTALMRDWLESLRPVGAQYGLAAIEEAPDAAAAARADQRESSEAERRVLAGAVRAAPALDPTSRDLIAELLWFHQRSQKPQWWAMFDRQTWSDEELFDDLESLAGLRLDDTAPVYNDKRSFVATYRFDPQDTKLKEDDTCKIALTLTPAGTIMELDSDAGRVVVRRSTNFGEYPDQCSLIPGRLIDQKVLVNGVACFAERFVAGEGDPALLDLLARRLPRLKGRAPGDPILTQGQPLVSGAVDAIGRLDDSYLVVQGPPGTGKTYTTSHAILALLKAGKRIAVSSNSHKAINNLLAAVEARAAAEGFHFLGAKKSSLGNLESAHAGELIESLSDAKRITSRHRLVGATAYHLALPDERGAFDYLFVDEAGQVSLGNLVAMAGCARNIVLVGDQMQLPQPVQGVHPGESGLSCLDYLMGEHATVPPARGILLDVSWRMHPKVCEFISQTIYEGRLTSHPETSERRLVLTGDAHPVLKPAGIVVLEIDHKGCIQSSPEEASAIAELVGSLLQQSFRNKDGAVTPLELKDILIVAPFNAQVNLLRRRLPAGARVGTVDKFQGQEAPVAVVSMATSHGADAPRGAEFLFNTNRLNVAVSRAQCLAILVRGSELLELAPGSVADLVRLDAFARADALKANVLLVGRPCRCSPPIASVEIRPCNSGAQCRKY
jgi:uncharacterized protein